MNRPQAQGLREGFLFFFNYLIIWWNAHRKNSTQKKQPWARRLGRGCNEWSDSVTGCGHWPSFASRLRVEQGWCKEMVWGTITLCSICGKWNGVFWIAIGRETRRGTSTQGYRWKTPERSGGKSNNSAAARSDQQASQTRAAGGLRAAETKGTDTKRSRWGTKLWA